MSAPFRAFDRGSIAVVGASDNQPLTRALHGNLRRFDPEVVIHPVNARQSEVWGQAAFRSLRDIPERMSLVVVMTPRQAVLSVVEDIIATDAGAALVYTAGFAEVGPDGATDQARLAAMARDAGLELWGPNCLGLISPSQGRAPLIVPASSVPIGLAAGPSVLISQSGGLMLSTLELASRLGVGIQHAVTTGNEAGVTSVDALDRLLSDPEVRVAGLIAEGIADGHRYMAIAEQARLRGQRIVALKLGRSAAGIQAVASHTAVASGSGRVFDGMCQEVGVAVVHTIAELVDTLSTASHAGGAAPGGIAAITISGGTSILVADLAERHGIRLAEFESGTKERLQALVPAIATPSNPLDVTTEMYGEPALFGSCADVVAADPEVAAVALVLHLRHSGQPPAHRQLVASFWDAARRSTKPFVVISSIPEGVSGYWREVAVAAPGAMLNGIDGLRALSICWLSMTRRRRRARHQLRGHATS